MIVISDTSPLNYLILVQLIDILPQLFQRIVIPGAVLAELEYFCSPQIVKEWANSPPEWLEIIDPTHLDDTLQLDVGETAAISLAKEMNASRILIDERLGANVARQLGFNVSGTLTVLDLAAENGLIDISIAIHQLRQTNFRCSEKLYSTILERDRQRRKHS